MSMVSSTFLYTLVMLQIAHVVQSFSLAIPLKKMNVRSVALAQLDGANSNISINDGRDPRYTVGCRRDFLHVVPKIAVCVAVLENLFPQFQPPVANAAYGDSTNIELPSYIDFLIEKNRQGDPSTFLYQGADRDMQLDRMKRAISSLETLPVVVKSRKWSQVQGIITGPLGTLTATMRQIAESNSEAQKLAAQVKKDLLDIALSSTSKDEVACLAASEAALKDVFEFVKIAL